MGLSDAWRGRRLVVLGDALLDRYVFGRVERISPEAPVPIVHLDGADELRPGGAANVAGNVAALGAQARLISVIGTDAAGESLTRLIEATGLESSGLVACADRSTPEKTRVLSRHQQMIRLDREDDSPVADDAAARVVEFALGALESAEGLIVSDYAKGMLDRRILAPVLKEARRRGLPVVIDPKIRNFEHYQPATVLTPNLSETARATARELRSEGDVEAAARELLGKLELDAVLVTRGEEGMLLVPCSGSRTVIPARAREVFDVTGAGDTVASVLGVALAAGVALDQAARWANVAAAIAVGRLGTAAVTAKEIEAALAGIAQEG